MAMDMLALGESIRELEEMGANADEETMGTPKGYEVSYKPFTILAARSRAKEERTKSIISPGVRRT